MNLHDSREPVEAGTGPGGSPGSAVLTRATRILGRHIDDRWVEVAPRILTAALSASRRSHPVAAMAPGGPVAVSEQVIVAYLRARIDGAVPGSAVAAIKVEITGRDTFTGVLIELIIQYGVPVLPVADRVRSIAAAVLTEVLGPAGAGLYVRTSHVHVSDVTRTDPQTTDPADPDPGRP